MGYNKKIRQRKPLQEHEDSIPPPEAVSREAVPEPDPEPEPRLPAYLGIILVALCTFAYLFYTASMQSQLTPNSIWYPKHLSLFNGTDSSLPLYLAIVGEVFDVTKATEQYGHGQSYNHFCGRDASRAFVTGKFHGDGLTDDVADLSHDELSGLEKWRSFYRSTYRNVGKLVGRFYDWDGNRTAVLENLERQFRVAEMELAKGKAEDDKYPSCNSRWSPESGGVVWCDTGLYPRKMFRPSGKPGSMKARCVCLEEENLGGADQEEYANCPPYDSLCVAAPP